MVNRGSHHWRPPGSQENWTQPGFRRSIHVCVAVLCWMLSFFSNWNLKFGFFAIYIRQTVGSWNSHGKSCRIQRRSSLFGYGAHPWAGGANRRGSREIWEVQTWSAWCGWLMTVAPWKFNVRSLDTRVTRKDGLEADLRILHDSSMNCKKISGQPFHVSGAGWTESFF